MKKEFFFKIDNFIEFVSLRPFHCKVHRCPLIVGFHWLWSCRCCCRSQHRKYRIDLHHFGNQNRAPVSSNAIHFWNWRKKNIFLNEICKSQRENLKYLKIFYLPKCFIHHHAGFKVVRFTAHFSQHWCIQCGIDECNIQTMILIFHL